jgi:pilus assembly protein Flp/PilA
MIKFFNQFASDESGATAIEYGLIAALIAVALISILGTVGTSLTNTFTNVKDSLDTANTPAA